MFLLENLFIVSFIYPFTHSTNTEVPPNPVMSNHSIMVAHVILVAKSKNEFGECGQGRDTLGCSNVDVPP